MSTSPANSSPASLSMDHVCPATRLLEKRRMMFEVQESLDKQQEIFAKQQVCVSLFFPSLPRDWIIYSHLSMAISISNHRPSIYIHRKHFDSEKKTYENMIWNFKTHSLNSTSFYKKTKRRETELRNVTRRNVR